MSARAVSEPQAQRDRMGSRDAAAFAPPIPADHRNYPYNCWWVAALSSEVSRDMLGRWLLDTPILLYRAQDGRAIALENRCAHRSAPLSLGCLKGDVVQCGYHGFSFGPDGRCTDVPSMRVSPSTIAVRAFPVIERAPFVWIYVGDPIRLADTPLPPPIDWLDDDRFALRSGMTPISANYMLLKENVLDLTHFSYVHAASFNITDVVDPPKVTIVEDSVGYEQQFERAPLPAFLAEPLGIEAGTPYNRTHRGAFVSPALQLGGITYSAPETPETIEARFGVAHATTPINGTSMIYFWLIGRDFNTGDAAMDSLRDQIVVGFLEDKIMIEAVQEMQSRDPRLTARLEKTVRADAAGIEARRIVARWMERETA